MQLALILLDHSLVNVIVGLEGMEQHVWMSMSVKTSQRHVQMVQFASIQWGHSTAFVVLDTLDKMHTFAPGVLKEALRMRQGRETAHSVQKESTQNSVLQ